MSVRSSSLKPSGNEHTITMDPQLVLRGAVTDAVTGEPLPAFQIIEGRLRTRGEEPWWSSDAPTDYQSGSYEFRFKYPIEGRYLLRVSAPGYEPAESRPIAMNEGAVTLDFALKPAEAPVKPPETNDNASKQNRLVIHANAEDTGKPLEGVEIRSDGRIDEMGFKRELDTDEEGIASLEWAAGEDLEWLNLYCIADGYVPIRRQWKRGQDEPAAPKQIHLQFETGKWIGGIVQDEDRQPIEGVTVKVRTNIGSSLHFVWPVAELKTGADGRWRWKGACNDLSYFPIDLEHPHYADQVREPMAGTEMAYVMKRGHRLTGRVLTADGAPIEDATVLLGHYHWNNTKTVTNSDGRFVLESCLPDQPLVTVCAAGFSPESREVEIGEEEDLGDFGLTHGNAMRIRIVDGAGAPIKGARFNVWSWRGHNTLHHVTSADEEGRVIWSDAPGDVVLCDVYAPGYLDRRLLRLRASEEEQEIILSSELVIRGNVTDADTGGPIPSFTVCPGDDSAAPNGSRWRRTSATRHEDGVYVCKIDHQTDGGHCLQVVAPGYCPMTSRLFKSDEGEVTFDFALRPAVDMAGTVLDPSGEPVAKAQVGLAKAATKAWMEDGHFSRLQNEAEVITTSESGKFTFPPQGDEDFLLIATHDSGFAQVTPEQFAKSPVVRLEPWGRIEGQVMEGATPDANRTIWFIPKRDDNQQTFVVSWSFWGKADAQGRFQLNRVMPGPGSLSRVVNSEGPTGTTQTAGWEQAIDVEPNEACKVTIGGTGRPVVGRFELSDNNAAVDWTTNHVVRIRRLRSRDGSAPKQHFGCLGKIDEAGRFEIPDVPSGSYKLVCAVTGPLARNSRTPPPLIGVAEHEFDAPPLGVPPTDEPLDLGTITVNVESDSQTDHQRSSGARKPANSNVWKG